MISYSRLLAIAVIVMSLSAACGDEGGGNDDGSVASPTAQETTEQAAGDADCREGEVVTTESGLKYEDTKCGSGEEAVGGSVVTVHYTGRLENGKKFDSSRDRGEPFQFALGAGQVIAGWDEGIQGMQVGGKRILTIPPELGYGATGVPGTIPKNATLIFDVELLEVEQPEG